MPMDWIDYNRRSGDFYILQLLCCVKTWRSAGATHACASVCPRLAASGAASFL